MYVHMSCLYMYVPDSSALVMHLSDACVCLLGRRRATRQVHDAIASDFSFCLTSESPGSLQDVYNLDIDCEGQGQAAAGCRLVWRVGI